jgi:hypothetical protein
LKQKDIEYDYETITRDVPLRIGHTVPITFRAFGSVINREDANGNPLPPKMMSFDDMWSELDSWERVDLITRKLKEQYELEPMELATGFMSRLANSATWELGDEAGSYMGAFLGEIGEAVGLLDEKDFKQRQKEILEDARARDSLFEALAPNAYNIGTYGGFAVDPTMVLGGISPALRTSARASGVRPSMQAASGVDYSVLNPATISSNFGLGQIAEAGAKTGLYGGATNVGLGGEFGEGFESGAALGSGIQGVINMASSALSPRVASTPTQRARERLLHAARMDASGGRLFRVPDMGSPEAMLRGLQSAGMEDASRLGVPTTIPESLGREASALQQEATRLARASGQDVADSLFEREVEASNRLASEMRGRGNIPDDLTAEQAIARRAAEQKPFEDELRDAAYGQRTSFTGSGAINTLKAWPYWKTLYSSVVADRLTRVNSAKGKPGYSQYWEDGYPKLLPKNFNDFVNGIRYIPERDFRRLVQQHGESLPFTVQKHTEQSAKAAKKADPKSTIKAGDIVKENGKYKVVLNNRDADYRTLHELRKAYDRKAGPAVEKGEINPEIGNQQRNTLDNLIKTSDDMRAHDLSVQTTKNMEDAAIAGRKAASTSPSDRIEYKRAMDLFRGDPNLPQPIKLANRESFVRSFIDTMISSGVTAKDILSDPQLKLKMQMIFNGLPDAKQRYSDFISRLGKEKAMSAQQKAIGERIGGVETTAPKNARASLTRIFAKIPAYAFSAAFGLQRDFMESFRVVMKEQTADEAAALNRISTLQPGTREFANEVDELVKLYELTNKKDKMVAMRNLGSFLHRLSQDTSPDYIGGAGILGGRTGDRDSRSQLDQLMDQEFMKRVVSNPVQRAFDSIFDAPQIERKSIFE